MVDVVLFPNSVEKKPSSSYLDSNFVSIGSEQPTSAFAQAYQSTQQTQKKDYISLVASSMPPDTSSEAFNGRSDSE